MNASETNLKSINRPVAPGKTAVLLSSFILAAGATVSLRAQEPLTNKITPCVLLEWPEPTEECIVVASTSLTSSAWMPCPEPIFKRFGQLRMAVPARDGSQFFALVPGTQFIDDFIDFQQPFTKRSSYTNIFEQPQHKVAVTNGVLRVGGQGPMDWAGILLRPPSGPVGVRDFYSSLDVLSWTTSGDNWSDVSLVARARNITPSLVNGYFAGLLLNGGNGDLESRIFFGDKDLNERIYWYGSRFNVTNKPPPYRLEFSGLGTKMTLRVLSLTTKEVIQELTITDDTLSAGWCGLYVDMAENLAQSHEVVVDNLFVTGTKP